MQGYTKNDLLRLAKRHHNTKRTYLLVDPLQGKHIPVSPSSSIQMLRTLGQKLHEAFPVIDIVIGFAETATAVGAAVAECQGPSCLYIHTTREAFALNGPVLEFLEEHSHAAEQNLCMEKLSEAFAAARTIAFVDDELSTGKTLLNVITQMREKYPGIEGKTIVAASIINRLTEERESVLLQHKIHCVSLLHLEMEDYSGIVSNYSISEAEQVISEPSSFLEISAGRMTADPRHGITVSEYESQLADLAAFIIGHLPHELSGKKVLILGTEEYMFPGMVLGEKLEKLGAEVRCHATTRSPIGICQDSGYPITSGVKLHSFYETERMTYVYLLGKYDTVIVLTDSPNDYDYAVGRDDLAAALQSAGNKEMIFVREKEHVQYICGE